MIKKFQARNMQEAMKMVKNAFGEDAVVLNSRKIAMGGNGDDDMVELTVSSKEKTASKAVFPRVTKPFYSPEDAGPVKPSAATDNRFQKEIRAELSDLKTRLAGMSDYLRSSNIVLMPRTLRLLVEEKGIDRELAAELVKRIYLKLEGTDIKREERINAALQEEISDMLKVENRLDFTDNKCKVICLVGPTGVGKTTSIIKLATHPEFFGNKRVALITIDTYRVAAAAQLKTFAALARLPLEIVYQTKAFGSAMEKFKNHDVILVDTAGRSPLNKQHLSDLNQFLNVRMPDEIHLVLSASTRSDTLVDSVSSFSSLPVNRIIVSKIDETMKLGNILNFGEKVDLPISFLTNGQRVPDDIQIAGKDEIASMILN